MDVLRLDPDTILPTDLVEEYSSMVWTERTVEDGEFELRTAKVAETKAFLPEGTLISHLDTDEVMKVESHTIEKDENENDVLLVKGRSILPTLLEDRIMVGGYEYGKEWASYQNYTTSEVISAILWNYLANGSSSDAFAGSGWHNANLKVPNLVVTDSTNLVEPQTRWFFEDGEIHPKLKELLEAHGLGVRSIRPLKTSGNVVSLDASQSTSRGVRTLTPTVNIEQLRIDIYQGLDRTLGQSVNEPVVFSYEFGDIDDPSYLFSSKGIKNLAVVRSEFSIREVWPKTGLTRPSDIPVGADLKVMYFDGGTADFDPPQPPEFVPYPDSEEPLTPEEIAQVDDQNAMNQRFYDRQVAAYNARVANFEAEIVEKAMLELNKHNRAIIFDGAISPLSRYKYREQYFLGDKVTLTAEYGVEETMTVVEYVRTEDQTGDRGYPTLVLTS